MRLVISMPGFSAQNKDNQTNEDIAGVKGIPECRRIDRKGKGDLSLPCMGMD